jgi:hypothetical protein
MYYKRLTYLPGIKKIQPQKFVWHLSPKKNRASILYSGLNTLMIDDKCVCANNQSHNILFFYPFCLDIYFDRFSYEDMLKFDFWRIDTRKVKGEWYIDPNMERGPKNYMGSSKNFIITEASIPVEALTLFKIDMRFMSKESVIKVKTSYYDGYINGSYPFKNKGAYIITSYPSIDHVVFDREVYGVYKNCTKLTLNDICLVKGDGVVSVLSGLPLVRHKFLQPGNYFKAA